MDKDIVRVCDDCQKPQSSAQAVYRHWCGIHAPSEQFQLICDNCNYSTMLKDDLLQHSFRRHAEKSRNIVCDICNYSALTRSDLWKHAKAVHLGLRNAPKICDDCGKSISGSSIIHHFAQTHYFGRGFFTLYCDDCRYKSMQKMSLTFHWSSVHSLSQFSRKLVCDLCFKVTANKLQLVVHMKKRHAMIGIELYYFYCDSCPYSTGLKWTLFEHCTYRHTQSQAGILMLAKKKERVKCICDKCDEIFSRKTSLLRHVPHCKDK